ncbi:MAG: alginate export family protein, partial [Phycisphaeraceae bacterium]
MAKDQPAEPVIDSSDDGRPDYEYTGRHLEDWSRYHPWPTEDPFLPLKRIDLPGTDGWRLSLGGSARVRFEAWEDFAASAANDDTFLLGRARLHADLHAGDRVRVFIEGMTAHATDRSLPGGRRNADVDTAAVHQAFAEIALLQGLGKGSDFTIKPGRQSLGFGNGRLIGRAGWRDSLWTWDGVTAEFKTRGWSFTPLWVLFVPPRKYDFDSSTDIALYGVYCSGPVAQSGLHADAYALTFDDNNARTFNGTTGSDTRYTFGGRLFTEPNDQGLS